MTKRITALALATGLALAASAFAGSHTEKKPAAKASGGKAVLMSADELKWGDPPNSPPGIKSAVVRGDAAKGAHAAFFKFPAGASAPMHHHTADHKVAVISGTMTLGVDGVDKKVGPGSYFSFSGKKPHTTKCEEGADCVLFVDCAGAWDVVLPAEKKAEAKKEEPKK